MVHAPHFQRSGRGDLKSRVKRSGKWKSGFWILLYRHRFCIVSIIVSIVVSIA